MISFQKVSIEYELNKPIVRDVSFEIKPGERVGLIGANGAGKSTIFNGMLGLTNSYGTIIIDGVTVNKQNLREIRKKVGLVLQNSENQLFMSTVYDDMMFAPMNFGMAKEVAEARVDSILASMGISELKHSYNHKLSGGEKKMAAIAAILAMNPQIVLMDEPTAGLDPRNRRLVIEHIKAIEQTCLIASHDLDMILDTCDRVLLISGGVLAAKGSCQDILHDKELLEANQLELPLRLQ